MSEPWFDPNLYAGIGGAVVGAGGAVLGPLAGILAPKGKCKRLVLGLHVGLIAVSLGLLVAGIVALAAKQPYGVWYGLLLPGVIGTFVFGALLPVIRMRYRQAEMRKSMAAVL